MFLIQISYSCRYLPILFINFKIDNVTIFCENKFLTITNSSITFMIVNLIHL